MGSSFCKSIDVPQSHSLIFLSNPQMIIRQQIERQPGSDIRQSSGSYIGPKTSLISGSYIGPKTSLILGCQRDQRRLLLNKYLLTYLFFIRNQNNTLGLDISENQLANIEIQDFTQLMTLSDNHKEFLIKIADFEAQYLAKSTLVDKANFLISEYFQAHYFSSMIQKFPIYSTDPTIIGYLRRPIIDLHNVITAQYKNQSKKKEIYCVIQIPKDQEQIINKMFVEKDHLTFSTFVRCFSSEKKARARLKELRTYGQNIKASLKKTDLSISTIFLSISITGKFAQDKDYGFFHDSSQKDNEFGDIIMNVLNFFQVTGAKPSQGQYDLSYGSYAKMVYLDRLRRLQGNRCLLDVLNAIQSQSQQIKTHSGLIRLIAQRNLSINASHSLRESQLAEKSNREQSINLIQAYLEEKNFNKALLQCEGKQGVQFQVRKAQILYEENKQDKAEQILNTISHQNKSNLLKSHFKEYVLCEYLLSKIKKNKGRINEAKSQLKALSQVMKKECRGTYEYRGRQVERQLLSYSANQNGIINWEEYLDGLNIGVLATR